MVDPARVPVFLRPIISWADRFGIGDSVDRSQALEDSPLRELRAFIVSVDPYVESIRWWGEVAGFSEERYAFMSLAEACNEAKDDIVIHPVLQAKIKLAKERLAREEASFRDEVRRAASERAD